jgi:hypothetical protein
MTKEQLLKEKIEWDLYYDNYIRALYYDNSNF